MDTSHIVLAGLASVFIVIASPAQADEFGVPIAASIPLNSNATSDAGTDRAPSLASDGLGHWVAIWQSNENLGGVIGNDNDIFVSRSDDRGATWSPPETLNTNAASDGTSNDRNPRVFSDRAGLWIAVWESDNSLAGTIGNDLDILISRSSDNGVTWTPPAALNTNALVDDGNDFEPLVVPYGSGNWIAVWRTIDTLTGTIGTDGDLLIETSTDGGVTWTYPVPLNSTAVGDIAHELKQSIATDGAGNWICVFQSNNTLGGTIGADYDILLSRSSDQGVNWTPVAPLNSNAASDTRDDLEPRIAYDSGTWMVVWTSEDSLGNTIGLDRDILVSRSTDNGANWSTVAPVNTNAGSDTGQDQLPQLACDHNGNWIVLWQSTDSLGGTIGTDDDLLVSRSHDGGASWTSPLPFNSNAAIDTGSDVAPSFAADDDGAWLGIWETHDTQGGTIGIEGDILAARFAYPDCNLNMLPDPIEPDSNGNGIPDECEKPGTPCPADIAPAGSPPGDGTVNVADLLAILNSWGTCPAPPANCAGDIAPAGGNGTVNVADLLAVINAWGACP